MKGGIRSTENSGPTEWFQNERIWKTRFQPELWEEAPEQVDKILQLLDLQGTAKILDLCCGEGRHSLELALRGHEVTGVDLSERNLSEAREKAAEADLEIDFVQEDMRDYYTQETFDVALNLGTSFGYFEYERENTKVIENIYSSLRSGGKFLLEHIGKEVWQGPFRRGSGMKWMGATC
ncbi:class I SAM-dependent methyltransferase [Candidatus Bipolaricaulota bacterium]|nr:class I SAM-dependent methyltransferase [Candidatus Bipolaricaulota bacterium]